MGRTFRSNYTKKQIIATAIANQEKYLKSLKKKNTAKPVSENIKKVVETKSKKAKEQDPVILPPRHVESLDSLKA